MFFSEMRAEPTSPTKLAHDSQSCPATRCDLMICLGMRGDRLTNFAMTRQVCRAAGAMLLLTASAVVLPSCSSKGPAAPTAPTPPASLAASYAVTTVAITSDPDDFVGRGRSLTFTLENSLFTANVGNNGSFLSIVIRPRTGVTPVWTFLVTSPNGSIISPGSYTTIRDPISNSWSADFGGDGRGCGSITGRMVVHAIDFIAQNQALRHFRASFEQHCEGAPPVLRGEVAVLADPWR